MNHRPIRPVVLLLLGAGLLAQDPAREIQELTQRIHEQMQEIDRLLLESAKPPAAGGSNTKELLQKSLTESQSVEQTLEQLIEKLNELKQRGGGGGGGGSKEPQEGQGDGSQQGGEPQPGQGQGQPRNRREGSNPDFVKQPESGQPKGEQQQQGQQQQQQQQAHDGQPLGSEDQPADGQNTKGTNPPDGGTAPGQPGTGDGEWGKLQPYLNSLKNRGSAPKVPEKYRKFWEAYLKARGDKK